MTKKNVNLNYLADMVEAFSKIVQIRADEILGLSHEADIVDARHVYWYLLRQCGYNYTLIGKLCDRTHATVMSGIKKVERLLAVNDTKISKMYQLTKHLKNDYSRRF